MIAQKRWARLIFGGGSAGARGSMVLLDEVRQRFPKLLVHGFLDSPYYLDLPSFSPKFQGFQMQHDQVPNQRAWRIQVMTC